MFKRQIRTGIRALTKHFGNKRWVRQVKLRQLDLQDSCNCVAGQIFGGYRNMPSNELPDTNEVQECARHGFHLSYNMERSYKNWQRLGNEWKEELRKLR